MSNPVVNHLNAEAVRLAQEYFSKLQTAVVGGKKVLILPQESLQVILKTALLKGSEITCDAVLFANPAEKA